MVKLFVHICFYVSTLRSILQHRRVSSVSDSCRCNFVCSPCQGETGMVRDGVRPCRGTSLSSGTGH